MDFTLLCLRAPAKLILFWLVSISTLAVVANSKLTAEVRRNGSGDACQNDEDVTNLMQMKRELHKDKMGISPTLHFQPPSLCNKDTGATCKWAACEHRRNATCVEGKCLCQGADSCAWQGACLSHASYMCHGRTAGEFDPPVRLESAGTARGRFWVSQNALDYLGQTLVDFLINSITSVRIPEISGNRNGLHYHISRLRLDASAGAHASFVQDQGVHIVIHNVEVQVRSEFSAEFGVFWTQGVIKAKTNPHKTSIIGDVRIEVSKSGYPVVWFDDVATEGEYDHIEFSGSSLSGLSNLITWFFKDMFDNVFKGLLKTAATEIMCGPITDMLQTWDTIQEIAFPKPFNVVAVDIGLHKIIVASNHIDMMVNGNIIDISGSSLKYPVPPVTLPTPPETQTSMVSWAATQTIINSIFWIFHEKNLLRFPCDDKIYPKESTMRLTTASLGWLVPGLWHYLFWNKTMLVDVYTEKAPKAELVNGEVQTHLNVALDFYVEMPDRNYFAFSLTTGLEAALGIQVTQPQEPAMKKGNYSTPDEETPECKQYPGETCLFMMCDSWQKSICSYNKCKCRPGACYNEYERKCEELPTTTPPPLPTPPAPPLQEVRFKFSELSVNPFKVRNSTVGAVNNLMTNWALGTLMPLLEKMVNTVLEHNPLVVNASASPVQPEKTSLSFSDGSVKIFSDFFLASRWLLLGEMVTGALEAAVNEMIYDSLR